MHNPSNANRKPCRPLQAGIVAALASSLLFGIAALAAGQTAGAPDADQQSPGATPELRLSQVKSEFQRPSGPVFPVDNQYSHAREQLGRTLFFDPRLSGSDWISCASCHNPGLGWSDGLPRAVGHGMQVLGRRTPTILNSAWASALFWDGRAETLEEQATGPIAAAGEMNLPLDEMSRKLKAIPGYQALFEKAYPGQPIGKEVVAKAIATFERTLVSKPASFDRWIAGDQAALSAQAKQGFQLFTGKAGCAKCHSGWRFTDDSFHDIGLAGTDRGRGALLEQIEVMQHAFKTPTLRNIARRPPYMHDGSLRTLEDVIDSYDRGGAVQRPSLSREIKPLQLAPQEKASLVSFLQSLNSDDRRVSVPQLPR
jgi:cytochrome c peroxidase